MQATAITFVTDPTHPGLTRLRQSCEKWGWPLHVIESRWLGWCGRLKRVVAEAQQLAGTYTHVVHVDAYDVVAIGPPDELAAKLDHYGWPPLLLAVEAGCWPDGHLVPRYEPRASHWWYPHSQYVLDLTQPLPNGFLDVPDQQDDQRHLHHLYLVGTEGLVLDRGCHVIQSIAFCNPWQDWFEKAPDGRILNLKTGTSPLFAHGNGKTTMDWVYA